MTEPEHNADSPSKVHSAATPPPLSLLRRYRCDVFAALWIPYALLVHRFWFVTDDAFISFRYAQNLVRGHGLRFNLGEHVPVHIVAVEKREPFRCGVWRVSDDTLAIARKENEAAIRRLIRCRDLGDWPTGYEEIRMLNAA